MKKVKVGVVGCGAISGAYLKTAPQFEILEVAACADLDAEKAQAKAKEFGIPKVCTTAELLADPAIEIVLNLTVPKAHYDLGLEAIKAGKHVYNEKPLALDRAQGKALLAAAAAKGLRVGCAPDTVLGAGIQTARKLLDDGVIGRPVAFTAFMLCPGHESWHPSPEFYYEPGGGPMFDMGPYYLSALMTLLGPVQRVAATAAIAIPERTITSQPKHGKKVAVETPDHISSVLEFANGASGVLVTSFATQHANHDRARPITLYGTEGTMGVPDPNGFDGTVQIAKGGKGAKYEDVPHTHPTGYQRMVGVADMAHAIRSGRPHRASGELALAVLDVMAGVLDSSQSDRFYRPTTPLTRPAAMPTSPPKGRLDD